MPPAPLVKPAVPDRPCKCLQFILQAAENGNLFLIDFHLLFTYGYKENGQDVFFAYDHQEQIV
jgi:hypothetical protein